MFLNSTDNEFKFTISNLMGRLDIALICDDSITGISFSFHLPYLQT